MDLETNFWLVGKGDLRDLNRKSILISDALKQLRMSVYVFLWWVARIVLVKCVFTNRAPSTHLLPICICFTCPFHPLNCKL